MTPTKQRQLYKKNIPTWLMLYLSIALLHTLIKVVNTDYWLKQKNDRTLLVYRSKVVTNKVLNYQNTSELYSTIDVVLERCIIMSHKWSVGDILFVNNVGTIHDRLPYVGTRKMLRVRFEDRQNILKPLTKKEIR